MNNYFNTIPEFWQGVFASIVATIICAIIVGTARIWWSSYNDWIIQRQKIKENFKNELTKGNDIQKIDAGIKSIFEIIKWLFIGNMFWVIPEVIVPFVVFPISYLLKLISVISFSYGLWWIYYFITIKKSPNASLGIPKKGASH